MKCAMNLKFPLVVTWFLVLVFINVTSGFADAFPPISTGTQIQLVLPSKPVHSEQMALEVLSKYLAMTGAKLDQVTAAQIDSQKITISIGRTDLAAQEGINADGLVYDGYRLRVIGKTVFVLGRDIPAPKPAAFYVRDGVMGTYKGALSLLHEFGFRFLQPSAEGVYVPTGELQLSESLNVTYEPPFAYAYFGRPEWREWNSANNFRVAVGLFSGGAHTYEEFMSADLYQEHPEYFRMENGERIKPTVAGAFYLCQSNPDVAKLLTAAVREKFDQGYDLVELAPSDGFKPCQCEACRKLDRPGEFYEQVHLLHEKITNDLLRSHPDKKVMLVIYPPTDVPSRHIKTYGPNVILEVCAVPDAKISLEEKLSLWASKAPAGLTIYVYYMGPPSQMGSSPRFTPKMAQDEIRKLARNHVKGIYFCGGGGNWGAEGPTHYVLGQLLGDPTLEAASLLDEYCRLTFGNASKPMLQFYQLWYSRLENTTQLRVREHYLAAYPPPVLARLTSLLQLARDQASDDRRATGWIESASLSLDQVRHIANVFHAYGGYEVSPSADTIADLHEKVELHKAFSNKLENIDQEQPAFTRDFLPGWMFYWKRKSYGSIESNFSALNAPFGWNFDVIMSKGLLPGTSRPEAIAKKIDTSSNTQIKIDGKLDEPFWQTLKWYDLGHASLGDIAAESRFRIAYDHKNMYVAVEAHEPKIKDMVVQDFGHDRGVYATESLELFFDPQGTAQRMMHLIANPTDTGTYDGKLGYIDDPLHPLVISGREDTSWNPEWKHGWHIDVDKQRWTIEFAIPFASLGQPTPVSGEHWRFNVGRERFPGNFKGGEPSMYGDLYLWSPNLESSQFCVPQIFGNLYFDQKAEK